MIAFWFDSENSRHTDTGTEFNFIGYAEWVLEDFNAFLV